MLAAASRGAARLADLNAAAAFVRAQRRDDGGFGGRRGGSDLYYTLFALEALHALRQPPPGEVAPYLGGFRGGESLDLVHLCSLIRCRVSAGPAIEGRERTAMLDRLSAFRSADGGFANAPGAASGTAYGAFLTLGAYQDLADAPDHPNSLANAVNDLAVGDGAYANAADLPVGSTPATAAASVALRHLDRRTDAATNAWLRQCQTDDGGFSAIPQSPRGDLLSTAVALHALGASGERLEGSAARAAERFVLACRGRDGGFGSSGDADDADIEYTFYALLALGHLSEAP